jgi:hypothetical protein
MIAMSELFTEPTKENVEIARAEFDVWKDNPDPALTELFNRYPENTDPAHVLLKVVALNACYATQIRVTSNLTPTVYDVARHVVGLNIDTNLDQGAEDLVRDIAYTTVQGKAKRFNYSFATKYCNWHRPHSYPIWDSRVDLYLWRLRNRETGKPEGFRQFKREELWRYPTFRQVVNDFKVHFRLEEFTFKQIDKFLFVEGGKLFASKENAKQSVSTTESQQNMAEMNEEENARSRVDRR